MKIVSQKDKLSGWLKRLLPLLVIVLFVGAIAADAQAPPNSAFCAKEFEVCKFDGEREVIYGANGIFVRKITKGGSVCSTQTFGGNDPVPGVVKSCYLVNVSNGSPLNFNGNWAGYYQNGTKSNYVWAISQAGTSLTFQDVSTKSGIKFSGRIENGKIIDSNGAIGTLTADGTRINWSNTYYWLKQNTSTAVSTPTSNASSDSTSEANPLGKATDLAISRNKSEFWKIGTDPQSGGFGIYKLTSGAWQQYPGGAVRIAVTPTGIPWVINSSNDIFQLVVNNWKAVPGSKAIDIDIGGNGSVYIVDPAGDVKIWGGDQVGWVSRYPKPGGGAMRITVDITVAPGFLPEMPV